MKKLTKKQLKSYLEERYPGAKRSNPMGGWHVPGPRVWVSDEELKLEAQSEAEVWQDGWSVKPGWLA